MTRSILLARPLGLEETVRYARQADEAGYDRVWLAETNGPDALVAAGLLAGKLHRAELGTAVVPVYTRSVPVLAMAAATASVAAKRTFRLGIGTGGQAVIEQWHGAPFSAPVGRVRDSVSLLRLVFSGEKTDFASPRVSSRGFRLHDELLGADVRLYVAALGPQMLDLAGAIADGVLLTWVPTDQLAQVVSRIRSAAVSAGRDPNAVDVVTRVLTAVTEEPAAARARLRAELPFYLASDPYNRFFASMGFEAEAAAFTAAFRRGDRASSSAAISDRMVEALLVAGSAEACMDEMDKARAAGATDVMVAPVVELGAEVVGATIRGCAP